MTIYNVTSTTGGSGSNVLVDTLANIEAVVPIQGQYGFPTDSLYRLHCVVAGTWSYFVNGALPELTKPPTVGWSWLNQSTTTVDYTPGYGDFTKTHVAAQTWYYRDAPSANYSATALIGGKHIGGKIYLQSGLALYEKATLKTMTIEQTGDSYGYRIDVVCHTNTAFTALRVGSFGGIRTPWWYKVRCDGVDVSMLASQDGTNFTTVWTEAVAAFFTTAPDAVAFAIAAQNNVTPNFPARAHLYHFVAVDETPH